MDLTSGIVWLILIFSTGALGFVGFWFSLSTLRWFTLGIALILLIAVMRFGVAHSEYKSANLGDFFLSGVDQVTIALLHPVWPGKVPAPGTVGRWIIAFALFLGYRQLEWWALRWQAPELDLSQIGRGQPAAAPVSDKVAQLHTKLNAELLFRLPTMEVRSPAILPGGTRANALASIAETSGVSGAGLVSAVVRFAGMLWPGPRLVRLRTWMESATQITVLLEDVKTGLPIATNTMEGKNWDEAASMVAGYIARQIFGMDRTVPGWCYGTADGRDLGAMQHARLRRVYARCPLDVANSRRKQIEILKSSTGSVRTAGIVRYELAQLMALERDYVEALRLHALNRELNERFYRGRYRFAMSLEMIADPERDLQYDGKTWGSLAETLEILSRCELTGSLRLTAKYLPDNLELSAESLPGNGDGIIASRPDRHQGRCTRLSQGLALKLLEAARNDLHDVRAQLSVWHVLRDALIRRDERTVWLPHWRPRYRQALRDGVCVAELLIAVRRRLLGADDEDLDPHLQRAAGITSIIAGDPELINAVLKGYPRKASSDKGLSQARCEWWTHQAGEWWARQAWPDPVPRLGDRGRRPPSWQAAYNTACLYAALADAVRRDTAKSDNETPDSEKLDLFLRELEQRTVASLRYVVEDPHSELERPSDWIISDPDFQVFHDHRLEFKEFDRFLCRQGERDYPDAHAEGKCPISHTAPALVPAVPEGQPTGTQPPVFLPGAGLRLRGAIDARHLLVHLTSLPHSADSTAPIAQGR